MVIVKLNGVEEAFGAKRLGTVNKGEEIYGLVTMTLAMYMYRVW